MEAVSGAAAERLFTVAAGNALHLEGGGVHWIRLSVSSCQELFVDHSHELYLDLGWPDFWDWYLVDSLRVYFRHEGPDHEDAVTGSIHDGVAHPAIGRGEPFTFVLHDTEALKLVFLRIEHPDSMRLPHPRVLRAAGLTAGNGYRMLFWGVSYGLMLAIVLYSLSMFASLGERAYIWLAVYMTVEIVYYLHTNALLYHAFPVAELMTIARIESFLLGLQAFLLCGLVRCFLSLRTYSVKADRLMLGLMGVAVVYSLASPFIDPLVLYQASPVLALTTFAALASGVVCFRRGFRPVAFFLAALLCWTVGVSAAILLYFGGIPYQPLLFNALQATSLVAAALLTKALGDRLGNLHRAKEAAEAASQAKSDFLASMSHEMRTPLHAILGLAECMGESELPQEQRGLLRSLRGAGQSLLHLVNDILDLSKVEAGQLTLEKADFSLREVIERVQSLLTPQARSKGLTFSCSVAPEVPDSLSGDPLRLAQVLLNLAANAVKFTSQGSVSLRVERDPKAAGPGDLLFTVTDTGIGIPLEQQQRIFERFSQADASVSRRYGGTGLGLAVCTRLVQLMRGDIQVQSTPGRGATFSFTASFDLGAEIPAPAADAQESLPDALPPSRILAADDSETNRLLLELFLRDTPWELTFARDGREAVDIWSKGRFDLVLLDVQMPVMDGYEALREIRRQEKASGKARTPIVVISAGAFDDDRRRSQEAGGDDYLAKPMKKHQLHQVIMANLPQGAAAPSSLP